jgi:hypothetical protein
MIVAILMAMLSFDPGTVDDPQSQRVYYTNEGIVACIARTDFDRQLEISVSGDAEAWYRFVRSARSTCVFLRDGLPVYRENAKGIGVIKIRPVGQTGSLYAFSGAVRSRR